MHNLDPDMDLTDPPSPDTSRETPQLIGRFQVESVLGRGGMGEVYKAFDPTHKRIVAIKILDTRGYEDNDTVKRFEREAMAALVLDHPNIGRFYGTEKDASGRPIIVMEFIEGEGQLLLCDMNGIAVASGSSCVSKSLKISHVLGAIGLDHALAQGNIIMSFGKDNTEEDVDYVIETFAKIVNKLRGMSPMWDEFEKGIIDSVINPTGRGKSFSQHAADVSGKAAH